MFQPSSARRPMAAGDVLPDGTVLEHNERLDWARDAAGALKDSASSAWDVLSGERDWRRAQAEAQKNRDFQADQASKVHQTEMADLAAAGLNPMMAAQLGGNPAPSGSVAHASQTAGSAAGLLDKGMGVLSGFANIKETLSRAALNRANSAKAVAEADDIAKTQAGRLNQLAAGYEEILERAKLHGAQSKSAAAVVSEIEQRIKLLTEQTSSAKSQAERDKLAAEFASGVGGDIQRWTDALGIKGRDLTQMVAIGASLSKLFGSNPKKPPFGFDTGGR